MKKFKKYIYLVSLIVTGCLICIFGFTFAKYVSNSIWDYYLESKGFYFSSDHLGSNEVKNVNNLWNGESVHFSVKNNLNQTVVTGYDINYTITCTVEGEASSYSECHLNGSELSTQNGILSSSQICINNTGDQVDVSLFNKTECELGGYDWIDQIATNDVYFDVILTDTNYEIKDVIVNVTATSTSPYHKTLSGEFKLHKRDAEINSVTLDYKNYSNYDSLIISNSYSNIKCVKINWNSDNLVIDAESTEFSSANTDSNGYINEIKLNIDAKNSKSFRFYKKDFNGTYNVTEFLIEETSGC